MTKPWSLQVLIPYPWTSWSEIGTFFLWYPLLGSSLNRWLSDIRIARCCIFPLLLTWRGRQTERKVDRQREGERERKVTSVDVVNFTKKNKRSYLKANKPSVARGRKEAAMSPFHHHSELRHWVKEAQSAPLIASKELGNSNLVAETTQSGLQPHYHAALQKPCQLYSSKYD